MCFRHTLTAAVVLTAAAWTAAPPAQADGFDARPITVETRDGLGSVIITNPGDHRIYLETQIYDWSQDEAGRDVLIESDTAIASPPATWIGPHSTYNLRVKLPSGAPGQERAFRILIKQLPDRSDITAGHIAFALTQSLPAFAEAAEPRPAMLHGRFVDPRHVMITNEGGRRARIANIAQDGRLVAPGLAGYALSRSMLAVSLASPVRPGVLAIDTDMGRVTVDVR